MTTLALSLVLTSAFFHATWNLVAKRVAGGTAFVWLVNLLTTLIYAPLALGVLLWGNPGLQWWEIGFIGISGVWQALYFLLLTRGYQTGDLSLVYPLARGTGPMLSTLAAIVLLGEKPSLVGLVGVACIGSGVFLFMGGLPTFKNTALFYALGTGACIATYTIWDKYGVAVLDIHPLFYNWLTYLFVLLFMSALVDRHEIPTAWGLHRREAALIAILSPLAYIMVLVALTFSPVSSIAPLREISIVIGAVMGSLLLGEGEIKRRWMGAAVMVAGVLGIAVGG